MTACLTTVKVNKLQQTIIDLLGTDLKNFSVEYNQLTIEIDSDNLLKIMQLLKDHPETCFDQCTDLCGVDYLTYKNTYEGPRFAVVYHLLSYTHNFRLRVKVLLKDDIYPIINSVTNIWPGVNWFEREAFDLFGIIFDNHPDLRRILTDYGFVGHPFRKDFPISGYMEVRYDHEEQRVIYQPVTIEPREITPRVIREENYCGRN